MAVQELLIELIVKVIITGVVIAINAVLIRELASLFRVRDESISTATAIAVWIGGIVFILSFLTDIPILGWLLAFLPFPFMVFLIKKYYFESWRNAILIWEAWTAVLIFIALVIYAIVLPNYILFFWGILPLAINIAYILFMKFYENDYLTNAVVSVIGFIFLNVLWYSIFKIYFPI